jgi:energy-coupling factor transport system permease protein
MESDPLNPLTKLWLGCMAIAAVWVCRSVPVLGLQAAILTVLLLRPRRRQGRHFSLIWPMTVMVAVAGLLFFDIETAFFLTLRVFNLLAVSLTAFSFISPEEIGAAMMQLRLPVGLVFMLTAGLRYVPLMENKIRSIRDAQQSRGIDLRPRLKNAGNWMAFLTPLLVQSFLLADELAVALESRGFARRNRSVRRQSRLTLRDGAFMVGALIALLALAYWERG